MNIWETIYIPLWLDLLLIEALFTLDEDVNLHSTMVRFIIETSPEPHFPPPQIYIPLWLDLLLSQKENKRAMATRFTFHYG